jgi:hypothetical protein
MLFWAVKLSPADLLKARSYLYEVLSAPSLMNNEFIIYGVNIYFTPNTSVIELEIKRAKSRSNAFYFYDSTGPQS